jgi:tripartite-type tricarboxylate transporter receptor subunit TctC
MVAPAKTPASVLQTLQGSVTSILAMPDMQTRLADLGAEAGTVSGADFGKFLADDRAKWTRIIQISGAKMD